MASYDKPRSCDPSLSINGRALRWLSPYIHRACRDDHFYVLLGRWECGAFDGGCLIVAEALRQALGAGAFCGLWGRSALSSTEAPAIWQHAVLRVGNVYADGDGVAHQQLLVDRWRTQELVVVTALRPMPAIEEHCAQHDTPYDPDVLCQMAVFFRERLGLSG